MSRSLYFSVALSSSLLACGSTIDVGQNNVDGGGGGGGDSSTAEDAAKTTGPQSCTGSDAGVGCNTLLFGDVVHPTCDPTGTVPAQTGGTITEGTYVLTARVVNGCTAGSGNYTDPHRETISYRGGTLDFAMDSDPLCTTGNMFVDSKHRQTWTASVSGTSLATSETCDTAFPVVGSTFNRPYSATATTLVLVVPAGDPSKPGGTISTYTLMP